MKTLVKWNLNQWCVFGLVFFVAFYALAVVLNILDASLSINTTCFLIAISVLGILFVGAYEFNKRFEVVDFLQTFLRV